jgi:hypothetical protein
MRCIFCKQTSHASRSVEHIIPESLGNTQAILQPSVVCDGCNNYFARKVEQPLLDCRYFKDLRGRQQIDNKRGRVPPQIVTVDHVEEGELLRGELHLPSRRHPDRIGIVSFDANVEVVSSVFFNRGAAILNTGSNTIEMPTLMSRFLAKVALEFLTERCMQRDDWQEFIIDNSELDLLRDHARKGSLKHWPYSQRTIYDENTCFAEGESTQRVWEWTPFVARKEGALHEIYSVLCLFGQEYAINYAGPDLDGYELWLKLNHHKSPLYI